MRRRLLGLRLQLLNLLLLQLVQNLCPALPAGGGGGGGLLEFHHGRINLLYWWQRGTRRLWLVFLSYGTRCATVRIRGEFAPVRLGLRGRPRGCDDRRLGRSCGRRRPTSQNDETLDIPRIGPGSDHDIICRTPVEQIS